MLCANLISTLEIVSGSAGRWNVGLHPWNRLKPPRAIAEMLYWAISAKSEAIEYIWAQHAEICRRRLLNAIFHRHAEDVNVMHHDDRCHYTEIEAFAPSRYDRQSCGSEWIMSLTATSRQATLWWCSGQNSITPPNYGWLAMAAHNQPWRAISRFRWRNWAIHYHGEMMVACRSARNTRMKCPSIKMHTSIEKWLINMAANNLFQKYMRGHNRRYLISRRAERRRSYLG